MHHEFARFIAALFPSIEPEKARDYLNTLWKQAPVPSDLFSKDLAPQLCQGDVVDPIVFIVQDDAGNYEELEVPGMVLSHSCDIDEDEEIIFAACRPFAPYRKHKSVGDIRNNTFFSLFYLSGSPALGEIVVDLATLQSVRRRILEKRLGDGSARRVASLSLRGYYFLIAKMTVRFLRPYPPGEVRGMPAPNLRQRVKDVASLLRYLARYLVRGTG